MCNVGKGPMETFWLVPNASDEIVEVDIKDPLPLNADSAEPSLYEQDRAVVQDSVGYILIPHSSTESDEILSVDVPKVVSDINVLTSEHKPSEHKPNHHGDQDVGAAIESAFISKNSHPAEVGKSSSL